MAITGEVIVKSRQGVLIAHEISDNVTVEDPAGIFYDPDKMIRVDNFIEESYKDADAYFFPLGSNPNGFAPTDSFDNPSLNPAHELNLSYDENGIFIGPSTENFWPDKTELQGFVGDGILEKVYATPVGINKGVSLKKTSAVDAFSSLGEANVATYEGVGSYSVSAYIRHSGGPTPSVIPNTFKIAEGTGGAVIENTLIRQYPTTSPISTQWNRIVRSADYTAESINMTPYIKWDDVSTSDSEYRLYGVQLEKHPFPTPFTASSRSAAQLTYNLNTEIGLDWSTPWTILYWKKAIGTDDDLTGYSFESLGMNSNSVGGGYDFWGKINGANTLALRSGTVESGNADFLWEDYQYNWHLVAIRYDGSETKLNIYGVNTAPLVIVRAGVIPSADYYVNQNGYDFQLGGYDLSHQPAAYYRGLTIYKRELTDDYVTKYYNTKLKIFNVATELEIYSSIILEEDL